MAIVFHVLSHCGSNNNNKNHNNAHVAEPGPAITNHANQGLSHVAWPITTLAMI